MERKRYEVDQMSILFLYVEKTSMKENYKNYALIILKCVRK
jgi:hypothetical protein